MKNNCRSAKSLLTFPQIIKMPILFDQSKKMNFQKCLFNIYVIDLILNCKQNSMNQETQNRFDSARNFNAIQEEKSDEVFNAEGFRISAMEVEHPTKDGSSDFGYQQRLTSIQVQSINQHSFQPFCQAAPNGNNFIDSEYKIQLQNFLKLNGMTKLFNVSQSKSFDLNIQSEICPRYNENHQRNLNQDSTLLQSEKLYLRKKKRLVKLIIVKSRKDKKQKQINLKRSIKQKIRKRKRNFWTREQNIKFAAFVEYHQSNLTAKPQIMVKKFCQYSTATTFKKALNRFNKLFDKHKKLSIEENIEIFMMRNRLKKQQIATQIERLNQLSSGIYISNQKEKQEYLSKYDEMLKNSITQQFSHCHIKVPFGIFEPYVTIKEMKLHFCVDPSLQNKNIFSVESPIEYLNVTLSILCEMDSSVVDQEKGIKILHKRRDQIQFLWKEVYLYSIFEEHQILNRIDLQQNHVQSIKNKFKKEVLSAESLRMENNIQNNQQWEKKSKESYSEKTKVKSKEWTNDQKAKFLAFLTFFKENYKSACQKKWKSEFFQSMASYIKGIDPISAYYVVNKYQNAGLSIEGLFDEYSKLHIIAKNHVQNEIKILKASCRQSLRNFMFSTQRVRVIKMGKSPSISNAIDCFKKDLLKNTIILGFKN